MNCARPATALRNLSIQRSAGRRAREFGAGGGRRLFLLKAGPRKHLTENVCRQFWIHFQCAPRLDTKPGQTRHKQPCDSSRSSWFVANFVAAGNSEQQRGHLAVKCTQGLGAKELPERSCCAARSAQSRSRASRATEALRIGPRASRTLAAE